jgi:hypothetical protein
VLCSRQFAPCVEIGIGDIGLMRNRVASKLAHPRAREIPTPPRRQVGHLSVIHAWLIAILGA